MRLVLERANKALSSLTDEELLKEVAPGKNRVIYLLGHLTGAHDAMFPILGLGERLHQHSRSGGIFHYEGTEDQFLSTCLAGATQSAGDGRAAWPHDRVRRVCYNRRREPIGCEGSYHLYGSSRPKGIRT
jgi:hypothetical protein